MKYSRHTLPLTQPDSPYRPAGLVMALGVLALLAAEASAQPPELPTELAGHTAGVNSVAWSPDQKYVLTASSDRTLMIWDAATGEEIRRFSDHTGQVLSVAFSPDGQSFVSGAADNTLRLWDVPQPDPLRVFAGHTEPVRGVAVSPNGQFALSFGDDRTGRVWNLEDGTLLFLLEDGHAAGVLQAAIRNDSNQLASGDADGVVQLWGILDGTSQGMLGAHAGEVRGLEFHPNNQQLITAGADGDVKHWQLPIVAPRLLAGHESPVPALAITPNGQFAVTGSAESVLVYTVASGQPVRELPEMTGPVRAVAVSRNQATAAAAGDAGVLKFWNLGNGADRLQITGHDSPVHALEFHPDNARIASADAAGTIRLWRLPAAPLPVNGHTADVVATAAAPNGQFVATGSADMSVRFWSPQNANTLRSLTGHTAPVTDIAVRPDSGQAVSADGAGELRFWNAASGTAEGVLGAHPQRISGVAYHPDGTQLATLGDEGTLRLWQLPPAQPVQFAGNGNSVTAVALTVDGKNLVTGGADKTIRVFDATNGQQVRTFPDVPEAVTSLALNADSSLTVAGSVNGVIRFWNTADGTPRKGPEADNPNAVPPSPMLTGHTTAVTALAFDTEQRRIVSAGADGTLRWWRLPEPPEVIQDDAGPAGRFVVSPDGKLAAVAGVFQEQPAILLRDLTAGGRIVDRLLGHTAAVTALSFHGAGRTLVSGDAANTVRVWNLDDAKFPQIQRADHPNPITAVALNTTGTEFYAAATDNIIRCWSVADGSEVRTLAGHGGAVNSLVVQAETLYSASADGTIRLWNTATGEAIRTISHGGAANAVAVAPDGKLIASGGVGNQVKLWNAADGAAVVSLAGHAAAISELGFSADGNRLVSLAADGLWLWDVPGQRLLESIASARAEQRGVGFTEDRLAVGVADGTLRLFTPHLERLIDAHPGGVTALALSREGTRAVSSGADKSVKLWELATGRQVATFAGPADVIESVVLTADGRRLLAGGAGQALYTWDVPAEPVAEPIPPADRLECDTAIHALSLSADNRRLAIGGEDQIVRIRDLELGLELERFGGHTAPVSAVAISADGTRVASGSIDRSARLNALSLADLAVLEAPAKSLAFLPDGEQIVLAGGGPRLQFWKQTEDGLVRASSLPVVGAEAAESVETEQVSVAVSTAGTQVASLDTTGRVRVWDRTTDRLLYTVPPSPADKQPADAAPNATEPGDAPLPAGQVSFSPDGIKLLVGRGLNVRVLDAVRGRMLQQFDEPAAVTSVAFSPDNLTLIVGRIGEQNNATLRQVALERIWEAHGGPVHSLAFTPNGQALASCGADGKAVLWSTAEGTLLRSWAGGGPDPLHSIAISANSAQVVAGGESKAVHIWPFNPPAEQNPEDGAPAEISPEATYPVPAAVHDVSFSNDMLKIAVAGEDGVVRILELTTGRELERFTGSGPARSVVFAPDNRTLVASGDDHFGHVLTMSLLRSIHTGEAPVRDLALVNNGAQVLTASQDGVHQWNLPNGSLLRTFEVPAPAPPVAAIADAPPAADTEPATVPEFLSVAGRPDNQQVAAVNSQQQLILWNLQNGQFVAETKLPATVRQLRYSPDSQKLVTTCTDDSIRFYSPQDASPVYDLKSATQLGAVAFTADSRHVLTAGEELREWLYASPAAIRTLTGHGGAVFSATFSPDGRWIASASADQSVRIWNADTGVQLKLLNGHQGPVYSVTFSPDGSLLASSGEENAVRVWDSLGGRQLKQIPVGDQSLYAVAFYSDGKRVAAAGVDRKIYTLDLLTGKLQNTFEGHSDFVYGLTFNTSGTRLLSCGYGGNIRLWNPASGETVFATSLGKVATSAALAPDASRAIIAGGDGKAYFVEIPSAARR